MEKEWLLLFRFTVQCLEFLGSCALIMANKLGKTVVNEMQTEIRTWGLWLMGIVISQGLLRGSGSIQPIGIRV